MIAEKPLITVLGLGEMGMVHAKNLSKDRRIRIGIASQRPDALKKGQLETSADKLYSSYISALEDEDVKGVVIATPPGTHPKLIELCIKHKKHILCEKPLGNDSNSIRESMKEIKKNDIIFMTAFMRRFDIGYIQAYNKIYNCNNNDKDNIGKILLTKCTSGDADYPEKYRRDTLEYAILKDLAVHDIDLIRWLHKNEIRKVYAVMDSLTYEDLKEKKDGDIAIIICELDNNTKAIIHLSRSLKYGYNVTTELNCLNGSIKVGDLTNGTENDIEVLKNNYQSKYIDTDFRIRFENAFENEIYAFASLIVNEVKNKNARDCMKNDFRYANEHDGLMATIVAEAMVKSAETGLPVEIKY